jgi:osmotically-inducible protein OsmY
MRATNTFLLALCFPLFGAAQPRDAREISDHAIAGAVEARFRREPGLPADAIDVGTSQGIVTLSGMVPSLLVRERAGRIAADLRGVRAVVNHLRVRPGDRPDAAILRDIEQALRQHPVTESFEIKVSVVGGVVTLTGRVQSWPEKRLAEEGPQASAECSR